MVFSTVIWMTSIPSKYLSFQSFGTGGSLMLVGQKSQEIPRLATTSRWCQAERRGAQRSSSQVGLRYNGFFILSTEARTHRRHFEWLGTSQRVQSTSFESRQNKDWCQVIFPVCWFAFSLKNWQSLSQSFSRPCFSSVLGFIIWQKSFGCSQSRFSSVSSKARSHSTSFECERFVIFLIEELAFTQLEVFWTLHSYSGTTFQLRRSYSNSEWPVVLMRGPFTHLTISWANLKWF